MDGAQQDQVSIENMNNMPKPNESQRNSIKRKSPDTPNDNSATKRPVQQNPHAHLAGQNQNSASFSTTMLFDGVPDSNNGNAGETSDPLLSDILNQVCSMQEGMNIESVNSKDLALTTAQYVNEKLAINAIQKQLMSFEVPGSNAVTRNNVRFNQPASIQMGMSRNQIVPSSYSQVNQYQTAPPAYRLSTQNINMVPPAHQLNNIQQRQTLSQFGGIANQNISHLMKYQLHAKNKFYNHQKRLVLQHKQQQINARQAITDNVANFQYPALVPFPKGMNNLMNNTVAPNVTVQRSTSMPEPQSPRYSNVQQFPTTSVPPQSPSQLSPGQRQQPPFSPMSQQIYSNNYPQSCLSPHLPSQPGPNPAWVQQMANQNPNLQQQNPMLNAQLSQQQAASFGGQVRFANQQPQSRRIVVRSIPSPGSRNSPYSNPPDSPFHPLSPRVALYQQQSQALPQQPAPISQQRLQRAVSIPNQVISPRGLPAGFAGNDPILTPQPSPGNLNPPSSTYNTSMPASTASNFNTDNFYDQQVYPNSMMDRNRGNGGNSMTSEYVRQELRVMVGARTQQHQIHQQQLVHQMPQTPGSQSSNQSLSQADFDAIGFSLDIRNDGPPTSPALFPQSLLNIAGANDNQSRTSSPKFQMEEQRPTEQKNSLLQQLLSGPP